MSAKLLETIIWYFWPPTRISFEGTCSIAIFWTVGCRPVDWISPIPLSFPAGRGPRSRRAVWDFCSYASTNLLKSGSASGISINRSRFPSLVPRTCPSSLSAVYFTPLSVEVRIKAALLCFPGGMALPCCFPALYANDGAGRNPEPLCESPVSFGCSSHRHLRWLQNPTSGYMISSSLCPLLLLWLSPTLRLLPIWPE